MLFEKARHPDQNLYIHPGTRRMENPTIRVPDFIERRYDNMEEERRRDGSSNEVKSQMRLSFNNNRHDYKSPTNSPQLAPILEIENVIKPQHDVNTVVNKPSDENNINQINASKRELAESSSANLSIHAADSLRHPLKHSWTLWYFNINGGNANWDENLTKLVDVNTVEDFWAVYHHMEYASRLESGCDYALFKTGIRPMWEDQSNKEGGRWLLTLERTQRLRCLDQIWLEIMLFLIGADHNESSTEECINGAVVNIRNKADKVSLWLSISDKSQGHGPQILEAGTELKKRMGIP